jgi:glycosidase
MLTRLFHHPHFYFLFLLFGIQTAQAQIVSITPRFPKITDSLTIIYDATKGNAGLKDSNEIYIHTGVITGGPNATGWSNVPMAWGSSNTKWRMENLGNNRFRIRYRPTNFYNISPSLTVYRLGFVFRNRSGSATGKTESNGDIFMPIYQPGQQAISFIDPSSDFILVENGAQVSYFGASNFSTNLQVLVDGNQINTVSNDTSVTGSIPTNSGGTKKVHLRASGNQALVDSFTIRVNQATQVEALPPGVEDGINIINSTTVILALRAPFKNYVYAIGEWNNWALEDANQMKRTPDGKIWWVQLNNLDPTKTYAYQYFVDGKLKVADPYSNIILDPNNDPFIGSAIYLNLKPYPTGKTTGNVSVFKTVELPYLWQNPNFKRPANKDLVVYELLIRDFTNVKTYKMLADTLKYLKRLGVNCVEIMPVMEFEGNLSWGYNPSHHYAIDKFYGTATAFKEFVDKAHGMCIAVVLDIALNHCFGQSPLSQLYWNSILNRPAANNPWLNEIPKHDFNVGSDFNHDSPDTRYYADRVMKHWLQEYNIDGFRWDLSKGFTQKNTLGNVGAWGAYDADRVQIWKNLYDDMQSYSPCSYCILEHFADNSEERELANYGLMFWGNINYNYTEAVMGWTGTSDLGWGYYRSRNWNQPNLLSYMESHDEERLMYKSLQFGNNTQAVSGYNLRDTTAILDRIKLASTFFYTIPGPKMLWQFGEMGYGFSINWPCTAPCTNGANRTGQKPIRWDYLNEPRRRSLWNVTQALIALKRFEPVFGTEPPTSNLSVGNVAMKRIYLSHPSRNVVVLGNFGVVNGNINPNFPSTGKWYEFFTGDSLTANNGTDPVALIRGEYRIYSNVKWQTPAYYQALVQSEVCVRPPNTDPCGIPVGILPLLDENFNEATLIPNPNQGEMEIKIPYLIDGEGQFSLVDISGRECAKGNLDFFGGMAQLNFSGMGLKPGIYGIRTQIRGQQYFSRLILNP